jgi:uncharacterized delta-60 repeat protein
MRFEIWIYRILFLFGIFLTLIGVVRAVPGGLDPYFGVGGRVTPTIITGYVDYYEVGAIYTQQDGKIVTTEWDNWNLICWTRRFNADGSPDPTYGSGGTAGCDAFGRQSYSQYAAGKRFEHDSVGIQSDGKTIVRTTNAIIRLNSDGSRDQTFGIRGNIELPRADFGRINTAVQPDGKIVYSYTVPLPDYMERWIVRRFNPDGTADTSFGVNGEAAVLDTTLNDWESLWHLLIQPNNQIVLAGRMSGQPVLLRLNARGGHDNSFGVGGIAEAPLHIGFQAVAIAPDNKIVGAGVPAYWCDCYHLARFDARAPKAPFDFDGDARSDISVFRPSEGRWYVRASYAGWSEFQFGLADDRLTPADYDGDGRTDISVFRNGEWWWIESSNNSVRSARFGQAGDIPVPGDFTGDGQAELALYRAGTWWTLDLTDNRSSSMQFGTSTDEPVTADYDGDGKRDRAVYRDGEWHIDGSMQGYTVINFGLATDAPVPADYDGDSRSDPAVYRSGTWYILASTKGFTTFEFGLITDIPVPADYDGDGSEDAAIYRDGTWWVRQSTGGLSIDHFGLVTDRPVPGIVNKP